MKVFTVFFVVGVLLIGGSDAQFFRALENFFRPFTRPFQGFFRNMFGGRFRDNGTQRPQATGRDAIFPSDCGRDRNKGTGKLCFPDGILCQQSK